MKEILLNNLDFLSMEPELTVNGKKDLAQYLE